MVASSGSSATSSSPALQSTTEGSSKPPATVLLRFLTVLSKRCGAASSSSKTWLDAMHRCRSIIGSSIGLVSILATLSSKQDDVYGDGVNIASRLEGIADPGQVYISGGIYEQIKHKLVCGYESLGDRKVKNITDPVRVYRVLPDPAAFNRARKRRENILIFLLSLILLAIASGALWYVLRQPFGKARDQASAPVSPEMPSADIARHSLANKQRHYLSLRLRQRPLLRKQRPKLSPLLRSLQPRNKQHRNLSPRLQASLQHSRPRQSESPK